MIMDFGRLKAEMLPKGELRDAVGRFRQAGSASASDFGAEKAKTNAGAAIGRPKSGRREESFFA
jgi:hypothetical protein